MLPPNVLDVLPDPIIALYEEYMQTVINDIARRLAKAEGITETAAWQMQRLSESGKVYENALQELAGISGKSEKLLSSMFQRAGVQTLRFDDAIYKAAGLNPLPLNLSPAMAQTLAAGLRKTQGIMHNLTMTTAITSQEAYIHAADLAYMQITGGAMDYQTAIKHSIIRAAGDGLTVRYPSGHEDKLDVALRRTILTGVNQTAGQLQTQRANELGADLVQISAHIGARNTGTGPANHESWQGKIFSRSGTDPKYPDFIESTGYGTGPGLMGWNCRHSFFPFFEGISAVHYKQAELDSYAHKRVTYNGQTMSFYEATQEQRAIERKIRKHKREAEALEAAGLDSTAERAKVRRGQAQMRDFVRQTGIKRQRFREQVFERSGPLPPIKPSTSPKPPTVPPDVPPAAPTGSPVVPPDVPPAAPAAQTAQQAAQKAAPLDEMDRYIEDNRRSLERANAITPAMLDAGAVEGDLPEYMYNFFAYDNNANPVFSETMLNDTKNDLFYNMRSLGKGHLTTVHAYPIREKAAGLLSGNTQAGGRVFSLKERRILERLASADDDTLFEQIDQIRDRRLRSVLVKKESTGGKYSTTLRFQSAQAEDAAQFLREVAGWR